LFEYLLLDPSAKIDPNYPGD